MSESTQTVSTKEAKPKKPQHYRFSVLLTAVGRFFRSFVALVIVILVNAIVQAALIGIFDPIPEITITFFVTLLISLFFLLWGFYVFNIIALEGATGKPELRTIFRRTAGEWGWFTLWAAIMYVIVVIGLLLDPYLAIIAIAILPFISLAAADAKRNPLKTNFLVIWQRIFRYLTVVIIFTPIAIASLFVTSIDGFFIGDALGSFITWVFWGIIGSWYLIALGLIYRSTHAGSIESKSPLSRPEQAELNEAQASA